MKPSFKAPGPANLETGSGDGKKTVNVGLRALDAAQVVAIDHAVCQVGEYGEIHLIVRRGQLRFIGTLKTEELVREA